MWLLGTSPSDSGTWSGSPGEPAPCFLPRRLAKASSVSKITVGRRQGAAVSSGASHVSCLCVRRCYVRTRVSVCAHTRAQVYVHVSVAADV